MKNTSLLTMGAGVRLLGALVLVVLTALLVAWAT